MVPPNSVASLELSRSLPARNWTVYAPPVFAPPSGLISFHLPTELEQGQTFFRVKIEPVEIQVEHDGRQITSVTTNAVPLGALLDALRLGGATVAR